MKKILLTTLVIGLALMSCKKKKVNDLKAEFQENYANIVSANYQDSYETAINLKTVINDFVSNPTEQGLENAKTAWLEAREPYGQTEAFRFSSGPIDDADGPEGLLNAWPLDEAYIDYVDQNTTTGIVNNATIDIEKTILEGLNEEGGEENISIGYHAIEFLLWGQDQTNTTLQTPGQRPFTDYVTDGTGTASNQDRRGEYLIICADLLVDHLQLMVDEWKTGGSYRTTFLALDADVAITNVLTGMGVLSKSELAGERIYTALDNQDQEDEHSCFSDNTHRDIYLNFQGVENIFLGSYTDSDGTVTSGTSLSDIIEKSDKDLNERFNESISACNTQIKAIIVPFDYALTLELPGDDGAINQSINNLRTLGDIIAETGIELGLTINTDLPG